MPLCVWLNGEELINELRERPYGLLLVGSLMGFRSKLKIPSSFSRDSKDGFYYHVILHLPQAVLGTFRSLEYVYAQRAINSWAIQPIHSLARTSLSIDPILFDLSSIRCYRTARVISMPIPFLPFQDLATEKKGKIAIKSSEENNSLDEEINYEFFSSFPVE